MWEVWAKQHPRWAVVVATNDDPKTIATTAATYPHLRLASDPGRVTATRYNAGWTPRAYTIAKGGRLVSVQADTQNDRQALDAAKA